MLERWKNAVVHLECVTDSEHSEEHIRRTAGLSDLLEKGEITQEIYAQEMSRGHRDIRCHGTALLLIHQGRRYLLTARHVVWDKHVANFHLEQAKQDVLRCPEEMHEALLLDAQKNAEISISKIIFSVPSIDEVAAGQMNIHSLMNFSAGAYTHAPYTFSDPETDLALISLDQRGSHFADELIARGYVPISFDDIANGPEAEGQELVAIGFPSSTALLGQLQLSLVMAAWSSSYYSLPISSFGRVSMLHPELPFFWADISIYPGNSGGPVIANDRLVGIVSAQATLAIDEMPQLRTRIPFGRIIKTSYALELLKEQIKKDQR